MLKWAPGASFKFFVDKTVCLGALVMKPKKEEGFPFPAPEVVPFSLFLAEFLLALR